MRTPEGFDFPISDEKPALHSFTPALGVGRRVLYDATRDSVGYVHPVRAHRFL